MNNAILVERIAAELRQVQGAVAQARPAVISESTLVNLNELRRFRYAVRSNYSYNLRAERVVKLMETLVDCEQSLTQDIQNFIAIA